LLNSAFSKVHYKVHYVFQCTERICFKVTDSNKLAVYYFCREPVLQNFFSATASNFTSQTDVEVSDSQFPAPQAPNSFTFKASIVNAFNKMLKNH